MEQSSRRPAAVPDSGAAESLNGESLLIGGGCRVCLRRRNVVPMICSSGS